MKSTSAPLLGPGAALLLIGLTVPALGQQFQLRGIVSGLDGDTACFSEEVAELCDFEIDDVLGNVVGGRPGGSSSMLSDVADDCDFSVEIFRQDDDEFGGNHAVGFEDFSPESQICGTAGAEAALIRNGPLWHVYCGDNVVQQDRLVAPIHGENVSIDEVAICFAAGSCRASSEAAVEEACAAFGTDLVQGVNLDNSGGLNTCACPEIEIRECAADDGECLFTTPEGERILLDNTSSEFTGGGEGSRCSAMCKSSTGGTGRKLTKCVKACKKALD